jgi:hypothetical protein
VNSGSHRLGIVAAMMLPSRTRPPDDPRNGPVILRRDLLAQGHNDRSISRLLRDGVLVRIRHGAFVATPVWEELDEAGRYGLLGRAVLKQAKTPVVLSHASGLPEFGAPTWGFDLAHVHATRTDGLTGRCEAGVRQHRGLLRRDDLVVVNGVPVMHPARLSLECTTLGNPEASLCVLNYFLHAGLTTHEQLRSQLVEMETWPDSRPAEVVLRLADARIESVGESRTLWCCFQQSLPMPIPQFEIRDASGRLIGRVDFAWPELGVFLEFDGFVKYEKLLRAGERASDVVVREKEREQEICLVTGWRCIRITWADLAHPEILAAKIRRVLFPSAA